MKKEILTNMNLSLVRLALSLIVCSMSCGCNNDLTDLEKWQKEKEIKSFDEGGVSQSNVTVKNPSEMLSSLDEYAGLLIKVFRNSKGDTDFAKFKSIRKTNTVPESKVINDPLPLFEGIIDKGFNTNVDVINIVKVNITGEYKAKVKLERIAEIIIKAEDFPFDLLVGEANTLLKDTNNSNELPYYFYISTVAVQRLTSEKYKKFDGNGKLTSPAVAIDQGIYYKESIINPLYRVKLIGTPLSVFKIENLTKLQNKIASEMGAEKNSAEKVKEKTIESIRKVTEGVDSTSVLSKEINKLSIDFKKDINLSK